MKKLKNFTTETIFNITYHPQSLFFVRPITRSSSSLPGKKKKFPTRLNKTIYQNLNIFPTGHTESVLSVAFSPDSKNLASGSGEANSFFLFTQEE